jgi:rhomboid protease GluP
MPRPDLLVMVYLLSALAVPFALGLAELPARRRRLRLPIITIAMFLAVAAMLGAARSFPEVLPRLIRTPSLIDQSELWRAVTALFVHAEPGAGVIFNLTILLALGTVAEQHFSTGRWLAVYLGSGILTEFLALRWDPIGGGNSIAVFGLAGALSLVPSKPGSIVQPVLQLAAWAAGAGLLIVQDIHGIGFWAGAAIAAVLMFRNGCPARLAAPVIVTSSGDR